MATIFKTLSVKVDKQTNKTEILIRFRNGSTIDQRTGSNIFIDPKFFSDGEITIKQRLETPDVKEARECKKRLDDLCNAILLDFQKRGKDNIPSKWLFDFVDRYSFPDKYKAPEEKQKPLTFFETAEAYLDASKFSESRHKHFKVIFRALKRYELYSLVKIELDSISADILSDFERFLRKEYRLYASDKRYQRIFKEVPESRPPKERGDNYIKGLFTLLRTFLLWCIDAGKTGNNPFKEYKIQECVYGRPIYITTAEKNIIYETDLSFDRQLEIQRDIFIFQCSIGCRVSDLYKFTRASIINGCLEYVPRKTRDNRAVTVSVPLNKAARAILDKYSDYDGKGLFPFISEQKYNQYIKEVFKACGITRMVTIINSTTSKEEQVSIADIASSHMARRTFVGNIYKEVRDANLVGSLSGHKEGSKAFARYRDIDLDIKKDLVSVLD